jgi:hypothetical protein
LRRLTLIVRDFSNVFLLFTAKSLFAHAPFVNRLTDIRPNACILSAGRLGWPEGVAHQCRGDTEVAIEAIIGIQVAALVAAVVWMISLYVRG